jgi:hypothetical protein
LPSRFLKQLFPQFLPNMLYRICFLRPGGHFPVEEFFQFCFNDPHRICGAEFCPVSPKTDYEEMTTSPLGYFCVAPIIQGYNKTSLRAGTEPLVYRPKHISGQTKSGKDGKIGYSIMSLYKMNQPQTKKMPRAGFLSIVSFVWAVALLLGGCAGLGETKAPPEGKGPALPASGTGGRGNGLDRELDSETRTYLEALSRAFASQDREYLLSQGEESYEAEIRPHYDEGSYLAMLYRTYAADSLWDRGRQRPSLDPGDVLGIEYLDWEEQGPHAGNPGQADSKVRKPALQNRAGLAA